MKYRSLKKSFCTAAPVIFLTTNIAFACPPCPSNWSCIGVGTLNSHCEKVPPDLRTLDNVTEIQIDGKSYLAGPKEKFSPRQ